MPDYIAPGEYTQEIAGAARPIQATDSSVAGFAGGTLRGPLDVQLVTSFTAFQEAFGGVLDPDVSYLPLAVRGFFENGGTRAYIARAFTPAKKTATTASSRFGGLTLEACGPGDWAQNLLAWIDEVKSTQRVGSVGRTFEISLAHYEDDHAFQKAQSAADRAAAFKLASYAETFGPVSEDPAHRTFVEKAINGTSLLVRAKLANGRSIRSAKASPLEGGAPQAPVAQDDVEKALGRLEQVDAVRLLMAPDQGRLPKLAAAMIDQCARRRDRFAILQGDVNFTAPSDFHAAMSATSFGAVYHPWIRVSKSGTKDTLFIPPSGHIAGIYARVDRQRGVHKAPANEVIRGLSPRATTLPLLSQLVDQTTNNALNAHNINAIRDFRPIGRGVRVFGARTFSTDAEWRYVPVRRLVLTLETAIRHGLDWVVFEPNAENLWARVRRQVSDFLDQFWRSGAFSGEKQDHAFFVKCDRTTMTQADIGTGRLICNVGVAPVRPAEFVIFNIYKRSATP